MQRELQHPYNHNNIMEISNYLPNAGRMPVLSSLPTLIQLPITLLEKLPCVAGVISGKQQGNTTTLLIDFKENTAKLQNYKAAMACFAQPGISLKAFNYQVDHCLMIITVSHSEILLN